MSKIDMDLLRERQAWPLEKKVEETRHKIEQFYGYAITHGYKGLYLAYSGGKDSSVLLHIIRSDPFLNQLAGAPLEPEARRSIKNATLPQALADLGFELRGGFHVKKDANTVVPAVFSDTGLEYPELRTLALARCDVVLHPAKDFRSVIKDHGYPAISKEVARKLYELQKPASANNAKTKQLALTGVTFKGRKLPMAKLPKKWMYLIKSKIKISDRCCTVMKKAPAERFNKAFNRLPILGVLAEESDKRSQMYIKYGCNRVGLKQPMSTPIAFWTEQDVLRYCVINKVVLPSVYGDIVEDMDGRLSCTGVLRTGCVFCAFGCTEEKVSRFARLSKTHPALWKYCCKVLRTHEVLKEIGAPVPPIPAGC